MADSVEAVDAYLASVEPVRRREDGTVVKEMMARVTGWPARMCGSSMVGFGSYNYTYESGHSGSAMVVGFAPRKAKLVLYIMDGFADYEELLTKLGKHKTGKSCLYINKLADVDLKVLETMIEKSVAYMKEKYDCQVG